MVHAPAFEVRAGSCSDTGRVRVHNEDRHAVVELGRGKEVSGRGRTGASGLMLCVCDGMGGAAAGEVASSLAVAQIRAVLVGASVGVSSFGLADAAWALVDALEAANRRVRAEAAADRAREGMGCTATVALIHEGHLLVAQVGDSRAYVWRDGRILQVTKDQSLAALLVDMGARRADEMQGSAESHRILQALGRVERLDVPLTVVELRKGDQVLVCSDGLTNLVDDNTLAAELGRSTDPVATSRRLAALANEAGGRDNITVVLCEVQSGAPPAAGQPAEVRAYPLPARSEKDTDHRVEAVSAAPRPRLPLRRYGLPVAVVCLGLAGWNFARGRGDSIPNPNARASTTAKVSQESRPAESLPSPVSPVPVPVPTADEGAARRSPKELLDTGVRHADSADVGTPIDEAAEPTQTAGEAPLPTKERSAAKRRPRSSPRPPAAERHKATVSAPAESEYRPAVSRPPAPLPFE